MQGTDHTTALHEAGHAVAHVRLGIQQDHVTILPHGETLGRATAEGAGHVWDAEAAKDQVIAYCAGYAALVASGHDEVSALAGADDDFAFADELIAFWGLVGDLAQWKARAVALMTEPPNRAAVQLVAEWLERERTVDGDVIDLLVDLADGEIEAADLERCLLLKQGGRRDAKESS